MRKDRVLLEFSDITPYVHRYGQNWQEKTTPLFNYDIEYDNVRAGLVKLLLTHQIENVFPQCNYLPVEEIKSLIESFFVHLSFPISVQVVKRINGQTEGLLSFNDSENDVINMCFEISTV